MAHGDTYKKELDVDLSETELAERKDQLVEADASLASIEADKRLSMQDFNKQLKDARASQRAIMQAIQTGKEKREVDVMEERDDKLHVMKTIRLDTKAVIDERPLTFEEQQVTLLDNEGGTGKAKGRGSKKGGRAGASP